MHAGLLDIVLKFIQLCIFEATCIHTVTCLPHVFYSSMSKLSRSVADLTDSGEAPKHRLNFLYRNQGNEERSTMTLPHKKNVSSMPTAEIVSKPSYMPQVLCFKLNQHNLIVFCNIHITTL